MKCLTPGLQESSFSSHLQGAVQMVSLEHHQERQDKESTEENSHCQEIKSKSTLSWYFWANSFEIHELFISLLVEIFGIIRGLYFSPIHLFLLSISPSFWLTPWHSNKYYAQKIKKNKTCINDRVFNHEHIVFYEYYNHRINKPTKKKQDTKRVLSFLTKL